MLDLFSKKFFDKSKKTSQRTSKEDTEEKIPKTLDDVKQRLKHEFELCEDFSVRELEFGKQKIKLMLAFIEGFTDKHILSQNVIEPIIQYYGDNKETAIVEQLEKNIISASDIVQLNTLQESIDAILDGNAVLYINGVEKAFKIGVRAPEKRSVEQPDTEVSIKGPREGFTENLKTNTILLRRKIKNTKFKIEEVRLGEQTKTNVVICYIQGIAKDEIVDEVRKRISKIKTDAILATGYIEQYIQDDKFAIFPMVGNSEKPDKVAAKLLEGRVAIIADGTPTVLTVPYLFIETIQAPEDYFGEYYFGTFSRLLRLLALFLAIYLPAGYVALTMFHQKIIPFNLMITMAAARQGIPFSSFLEALFMILVFEILREAGVRMPRAIGQAVSIVGAIVLGDAAVSAGIASAPIVIITALSGICSFTNPPLMKINTILRIAFLIAANTLGILGITILTIAVFTYLCNKRVFGVPYLTPFSPLTVQDLKDSFIVVPIWAMISRPKAIANANNKVRTKGKSLSKEDEDL